MKQIFVNLKRFDVPQQQGGLCPDTSPARWIRNVAAQCLEMGLGKIDGASVVLFLPEALLVPALEALEGDGRDIGRLSIGCQSVYREDVEAGKNFGAFTANRPAAAMEALGCKWAMIGHSEERKDKLDALSRYDGAIATDQEAYARGAQVVEAMLNEQVRSACARNLNVLFCVGETLEQKGSQEAKVYQPRVKRVLEDQLLQGLRGLGDFRGQCKLTIGYEPIWAIGPGKTPPDGQYIGFVSGYIKEVCLRAFGRELPVVYGGGLKEETAQELATVSTVDGGLVALTKFTQPIAFDVASLKRIILEYLK